MKILFKDVYIIDENAPGGAKRVNIATDGEIISYVGDILPAGEFDRTVTGNYLAMPGFYNAHCHSAMNLLRGIGGDLPLRRWLDEAIFPAEDRLNEELVGLFSLASIAEMIAGGCVSFSDMYFFCEPTVRAVIDAGVKVNVSRSVVSFDENCDVTADVRVREMLSLFREYNGAADGRVIVDFALHAQYSNTPRMCEYVGELARKYNAGMQIHLSETEGEHLRCIEKYSLTPTAYFKKYGVLGEKTSCAHGVWVSDDDIETLAQTGSSVIHCPRSNLKLGSGVAPLARLLRGGVNVALGTDGAASNNKISVLDEFQTAQILHKGVQRRADETKAAELLPLLSENGARSQGRCDCGKLEAGYRADIALIGLDGIHNLPISDMADHLSYSVYPSDVEMTVCDGKILYDHGEYTTIDIEKLKHRISSAASEFFGGRILEANKK